MTTPNVSHLFGLQRMASRMAYELRKREMVKDYSDDGIIGFLRYENIQ